MTKPEVQIITNVTREQSDALRDILDQLAGTPLERTGDIVIILHGVEYVVSGQPGHVAHAAVVRHSGAQIVAPQYRVDVVAETASEAWALAQKQQLGVEFTMRELVPTLWADLSAVEQRNAGKSFRLIGDDDLSADFDQWKTSDNEWHYRRRR